MTFVGRGRQFERLVECLHTSTDKGQAQLVRITGTTGIGKSRLASEFISYLDGMGSTYQWQKGRCPVDHVGSIYAPLAEMLRDRAGVLESDEPGHAAAKIQQLVASHLSDPEDRRFVEPHLLLLLGIQRDLQVGTPVPDQKALFSAWRLLFQRLAEKNTVVMVFEDMQWASPSLIKFVEHLLNFSPHHPIYVLTCSRQDSALLANGPNFQHTTSVHLEPLTNDSIRELIDGFAGGPSNQITEEIVKATHGVPLYAIETMRLLSDRGLVDLNGEIDPSVEPIAAPEFPPSIAEIVRARIDQLIEGERRVVQDAAVLGGRFSKAWLSAIDGNNANDLDAHLSTLVEKEVLYLTADSRSSKLGQYGFCDDLMRSVAYECVPTEQRKQKHLLAAELFSLANDQGQSAAVHEIVATHLLYAYSLDTSAVDADEIRDRARAELVQAGNQAATQAANDEAEGYFEQACTFSNSIVERAELTERAGEMARLGGKMDRAASAYEIASGLFDDVGLNRSVARCQTQLAITELALGRLDQAVDRIKAAYDSVSVTDPDPDFARMTAELGRILAIGGHHQDAVPYIERALEFAQHLELPEVYAETLAYRSIVLMHRGRLDEADMNIRRAIEVALQNGYNAPAFRAYHRLGMILESQDRFDEQLEVVGKYLALALRLGERFWEFFALTHSAGTLMALGRWDEALDAGAGAMTAAESRPLAGAAAGLSDLVNIHVNRGELDKAHQLLESLPWVKDHENPENRVRYELAKSVLARSEDRLDDAMASAEYAYGLRDQLGIMHSRIKKSLVQVAEVALEGGDLERVTALLQVVDGTPLGEVTPWLRAQAVRLSARLAAAKGEPDEVSPAFTRAEDLFRQLGTVFDLAVTILEHAEWLEGNNRPGERNSLIVECEEIFEQLQARPWLKRLRSSI